MKRNNGFAISVLLYGILILTCFTLLLLTSVKTTSYKNNKVVTTATKNELTCASKLEMLELEVANGKTLLANSITSKGVTTLNTDSFTTMASNVDKISVATPINIEMYSVSTYQSGCIYGTNYLTMNNVKKIKFLNNEIKTVIGYSAINEGGTATTLATTNGAIGTIDTSSYASIRVSYSTAAYTTVGMKVRVPFEVYFTDNQINVSQRWTTDYASGAVQYDIGFIISGVKNITYTTTTGRNLIAYANGTATTLEVGGSTTGVVNLSSYDSIYLYRNTGNNSTIDSPLKITAEKK